MLSRGRRQELAEINREADKRAANWAKAPIAQLVTSYLYDLKDRFKKQLSRDRVEQLAWSIEDSAQRGFDLTEDQVVKIHAYVDHLISKE